jgi:hypothetical protein
VVIEDRVVRMPLLGFAETESVACFTLLLRAAACRVPAEFFAGTATLEMSVADADGRELGRWDGSVWKWRTNKLQP